MGQTFRSTHYVPDTQCVFLFSILTISMRSDRLLSPFSILEGQGRYSLCVQEQTQISLMSAFSSLRQEPERWNSWKENKACTLELISWGKLCVCIRWEGENIISCNEMLQVLYHQMVKVQGLSFLSREMCFGHPTWALACASFPVIFFICYPSLSCSQFPSENSCCFLHRKFISLFDFILHFQNMPYPGNLCP